MKLDLNVLASVSIKRKKPWPEFHWIGEGQENIIMLDQNRISILYPTSGKTKKKIPKLSNLLEDVSTISCSRNGRYLVGLLYSGGLFLWQKEKDELKNITGLDSLSLPKEGKVDKHVRPSVVVSDDGSQICVITSSNEIFLWVMNSKKDSSKKSELSGKWISIAATPDIPLSTNESRDAVRTVIFQPVALGWTLTVSFIFTFEQQMIITTMILKPTVGTVFLPQDGPPYQVSWSYYQYKMASLVPNGRAIMSRGVFVASYANRLDLMALCVNQRRAVDTRLVYFSPVNETMLVVDMKNCGITDPGDKHHGRTYWLADLSWSHDDLFIVCITKHGKVCIITRLGEPVVVQSEGFNVDLGPGFYLPMHPLVTVQSWNRNVNPNDLDSCVSEMDLMRQRFSVATHPTEHLYLVSDGYSVTVFTVLDDLDVLRTMHNFVVSANRGLLQIGKRQNLELTLADTIRLNNNDSDNESLGSSLSRVDRMNRQFSFEDKVDSSIDSFNASLTPPMNAMFNVGDMDAGKIIFGTLDVGFLNKNRSFNSTLFTRSEEERALDVQNLLLSAFGLSVTNSERLTYEMETLTSYILHLVVKLFKVILHLTGYSAPDCDYQSFMVVLYHIANAFKSVVVMCQFDAKSQNTMPIMVKFVRATVGVLLQCGESEEAVRLEAMKTSLVLLQFLEEHYSDIYPLTMRGSDDVTSAQRYPIPRGDEYHSGFMNVTMKGKSRKTTHKKLSQILNKRLTAVWYRLYQNVSKFYKSLTRDEAADSHHQRSITKLLCRTQKKLQKLGVPLKRRRCKTEQGDGLYLEGKRDLALSLWKETIRNMDSVELHSKRTSRILHSILYTSIEIGDLNFAVRLADALLVSINQLNTEETMLDDDLMFLLPFFNDGARQKSEGDKIILPCTEYRPARALISSLARFMSAHFCNQTLYISSGHDPKPLPPLNSTKIPKGQIIPVYHETVALIIRENGLGEIWTAERALEYLLIAGLLVEAIWFADKMGDWKTAFVIAATFQNRRIEKMKVRRRLNVENPIDLPDDLRAGSIIREKLKALLVQTQVVQPSQSPREAPKRRGSRRLSSSTGELLVDNNTEQMKKTVNDLLLASAISRQDTLPWLLSELVSSLQDVVAEFEVLVPNGFYLPAPPLYCAQPGHTAEEQEAWSETLLAENERRGRAASLIQNILVLIHASRCQQPFLNWYAQQLKDLHETGAEFRYLVTSVDIDVEEIFHFTHDDEIELDMTKNDIRRTMTAMRDFMTLMWVLHVRDQMSLSLRKRTMVVKTVNVKSDNDDVEEKPTIDEERWLMSCYSSLQWTIAMIPFSRYLDKDGFTYEILLSLLVEFPSNPDSADILVEFFYKTGDLPATVDEKFQRVMKNWQRIYIGEKKTASSTEMPFEERLARLTYDPGQTKKGKSLSSYFHHQSILVPKQLNQKAKKFGNYEEFVFDPASESKDTLNLGSRCFEIEGNYLTFLDTFFSVCFQSNMDSIEGGDVAYPYLVSYCNQIRKAEIDSFSSKVARNLQSRYRMKHSESPMPSPRVPESPRFPMESPRMPPESPRIPGTPPISPRKPNSARGPTSANRPRLFKRSMSVQEVEPIHSQPVSILKKRSKSQTNLSSIGLDESGKSSQRDRSVSFCQDDSMYFGHYPMHRANSLSVVNTPSPPSHKTAAESPVPALCLNKDHRSLSLSDLREKNSDTSAGVSRPDVSFTIFLACHAGVKDVYPDLAKLLDWLVRWSNKHHTGLGPNQIQPAIRVKFHPYIVLLCLWLMENRYGKKTKLKSKPQRGKSASEGLKVKKSRRR